MMMMKLDRLVVVSTREPLRQRNIHYGKYVSERFRGAVSIDLYLAGMTYQGSSDVVEDNQHHNERRKGYRYRHHQCRTQRAPGRVPPLRQRAVVPWARGLGVAGR